MSPPWQELLSPLFRTSRTKSRKKPPQSTSQPVAAFAKTVWRRPGSRAFLLSQHTTSHPQSQTLSQTFGMEGKQRDTSNKQPLLSRQTPRIPSNSSCHAPSRRTPPQSTPSPLHSTGRPCYTGATGRPGPLPAVVSRTLPASAGILEAGGRTR